MTVLTPMQTHHTPEATTTDEELLARYMRGDDVGFSELYRRHNQRLFNYCAKMLADDAAAEDIVQLVWERLLRACRDGEAIIRPLGFLVRAARNASLDWMKHEKFRVGIDGLKESSHPRSHQPELTHEEALVIAALEALPVETKEVMVLHYYSGYSFEEIAEIFGKKPNAIWTQASRARAQLKKKVERELRRDPILTSAQVLR